MRTAFVILNLFQNKASIWPVTLKQVQDDEAQAILKLTDQ
jgi:hypothetical protein